MAKKKYDTDGIVYSTDPAFQPVSSEDKLEVTPHPAEQALRVRLDTKHRSGKGVTLVENFVGKEEDLEQLGKNLKTFCGTGGSVKDWHIIIQGDQREKVFQWLIKNGYKKTNR